MRALRLREQSRSMRPSKDASVSEARGYAQRPCYRSRRSCAHDHWCTVGVCRDRAVTLDAMRAWGHIGRGLEGKRCVRNHSIGLSTAMSRYARLALASLSAIVLACHNDPGGPATRTDPDTGLISFASVRSGLWDTCGIATSGTYCWGLGDSVPSRVRGGMQFYMVEASALNAEHRACGLTSSGAPYCWTPCAYTTAWTYCQPDDSLPVAVPGNHQFSTLTIGGGELSPDHACGLTGSGAAYCWGDNGSGELGDGTRVGQILGPGGWPTDTAPVAVVGGPRFTTISAGGSRTCGIAVGGDAYCWGLNALLGTDDTTSEFIPVPTPVVGGLKYSTVSLGVTHTCALILNGAAYCWGGNYDGELGMGDLSIRFQRAPVPVAGQLSFVAVSMGERFGCGLTDAGEVYCWGRNAEGQLGNGDASGPEQCPIETCSPRPVRVATSIRFSAISAGGDHVCGLAQDGIAYCWGRNTSGELGNARATSGPCGLLPQLPPPAAQIERPYCAAPVKVARQR